MEQLAKSFELPIFFARQYFGLLVLLAAAWSVGRWMTARLTYRNELEAAVVSTTLGLGTWGTALFFLALAGLFRPVPILILLVASQVACRGSWVCAAGSLKSWMRGKPSNRRILGAAVLAVFLAPLVTLPLYPPTAFDATMFHLPLADAIADQGRIDFFEHLRYPVFPALQEVLYAAAMLFHNDVAPAMVHYGSYLLVALLLYSWASWLASPRAALWAALLWLGTPAAMRTASAAYVDCGLTLQVGTAIFALHRYVRRGERGWLVVAAALLGFAAATKYHGHYFVVTLSVAVVVYALLNRRWRDLAWYSVVLLATILPWYGFIYYHTGNPVFPFFPAVFGISPWAYEVGLSAEIAMSHIETGPLLLLAKLALLAKMLLIKAALLLDRNLVETLWLPHDIFRAGRYKGFDLSPLFLFVLPPIAFMAFRLRHVRYFVAIVGLYLVAWAATAKDLRYLLPVLPLVALVGAEGLDRLVDWITPRNGLAMRRILTLAVTIPLVLQIQQVSARLSWSGGRTPTNKVRRERYLTPQLNPYGAIQNLNQLHGANYSLYALFCENMKYFIEGRHYGDWFGPERYGRVIGKLNNAPALHRTLTRIGADYLLLPDLTTWKQQLSEKFVLPTSEQLAPWFETVYEDRFSQVYRVVPRQELPPIAPLEDAAAQPPEASDNESVQADSG